MATTPEAAPPLLALLGKQQPLEAAAAEFATFGDQLSACRALALLLRVRPRDQSVRRRRG